MYYKSTISPSKYKKLDMINTGILKWKIGLFQQLERKNKTLGFSYIAYHSLKEIMAELKFKFLFGNQ